jgi:hypothetical protein
MESTATTLLHVRVDDVGREDELMAWIDRVVTLLERRFRLSDARVLTPARGVVEVVLEFPLPGTWKVARADPRFTALLAACPEGELTETLARRWRAVGNPRDLTTSTLHAWIGTGAAGRRDLVVADARDAARYALRHLPGAVHLPAEHLTAARAEAALGPDRGRRIVVYCSGFD